MTLMFSSPAHVYDEVHVPPDRHSLQGHASPSPSLPHPSTLSVMSTTTAASDKSLLSSLSMRSVPYEHLHRSESRGSLTSSASTMTNDTRAETRSHEGVRANSASRTEPSLYEPVHVYDEVTHSGGAEGNYPNEVARSGGAEVHSYDEVARPGGGEVNSDSSSNTSGGYLYQTLGSSAEMLSSANVYDDVASEVRSMIVTGP